MSDVSEMKFVTLVLNGSDFAIQIGQVLGEDYHWGLAVCVTSSGAGRQPVLACAAPLGALACPSSWQSAEVCCPNYSGIELLNSFMGTACTTLILVKGLNGLACCKGSEKSYEVLCGWSLF